MTKEQAIEWLKSLNYCDGVYRRGIGAESKCPINNSRVFEGTFYCADFEKRGAEND